MQRRLVKLDDIMFVTNKIERKCLVISYSLIEEKIISILYFNLYINENYYENCQGTDKLFLLLVQTKDSVVRDFHISHQPTHFM